MKPLEDGLEGMIESGKMPDDSTALGAYLKSNPAVREEVAQMMEISRLIRENFALSAAEREDLEPAPGFYARVMARIEEQAVAPSMWAFFLEPLGMRLVYASLALAVLLFAATAFDAVPGASNEPVVATGMPAIDAPSQTVVPGAFLASDYSEGPLVESANPAKDRGAALVQLTTYEQ
jgi:anti-sigma factor RsiW